ncbi:membrane protein [Luteitalea sp. TBR-22]|uniref:methanethiol S-methyltransferase n=1 Tax=Luteitalea sp. TBR-22 TaxID=2802971 RepID=UPI001AF20369|nr:methanethiol S-methyltransferase [Luteitalea sp. TBR-22]BCS31965.1 membrane protein [Luteitalea sp. TBR-22]
MVKRSAVLVYGVLAYLLFFVTFLHAIAFVGGFVVPRQIDGEPGQPLGLALAIDLCLLSVFAVQHSVMARPWFKAWLTRFIPREIERSTYVACASLALQLLFWQWQPLGGRVWEVEDPAGRAALWTGFASGWGLVLVVTFLINHFDLFGLRQVWLAFRGTPYTRVPFTMPGPYRMVRHPLYLGFLLAFWMTPTMTATHLFFAAVTTAYILVAIQFEERDLIAEHGETYQAYRSRVPMIVPGRTSRATMPTAGGAATPGPSATEAAIRERRKAHANDATAAF